MPDPGIAQEQPEGSLVFESKERAAAFAERVALRAAAGEREPAAERVADRERALKAAIRTELAQETAAVAPPVVERPGEWQYTAEDQERVAPFVRLAFATDVRAAADALVRKLGGQHDEGAVLRSLDLFHDTLTDHLYAELQTRGMLPTHGGS